MPVFEVLRDGSWLLDGSEIRADAGDPHVTMRRLLSEQARRMPQVLPFEGWKGPPLPANPLFLRVDREAPWGAVHPIVYSCSLQGIFIFDIDIQVASPERELRVLRLAIPRVMGVNVCYAGLPRLRSLILEAGTPVRAADSSEVALPVDLELRGIEILPQEAPHIEARFRDTRDLIQELREIAEAIGTVDIRLPDSAPAWMGVLAVDLAREAGVRFAEVRMEDPDETQQR